MRKSIHTYQEKTLHPMMACRLAAILIAALLYTGASCPLSARQIQDSTLSVQNISTSYNYVVSTTFLQGEYAEDIQGRSEIVRYMDGFGNLRQQVDLRSSPKGNNMVQFTAYDRNTARQSRQYLPLVTSADQYAAALDDVVQAQRDFYDSPPEGIAANSHAYSATVTNRSPLAIVKEQGGVGREWQPHDPNLAQSGHTLRTSRKFITVHDSSFTRWKMTATGIAIDTTPNDRPDNKLVVDTMMDENWQGGRTGTSVTYTDMQGRLRLSRKYLDEATCAETAYLYDVAGRLHYVVTPGAPKGTIAEGDPDFDRYLYAYRYNDRGQLWAVKLPQKGWSYMVYDRLHRPVLSQDSLQRERQLWAYVKYDKLGRGILSGVVGSALGPQLLQQQLDTASYFFEERNLSSSTGYTSRVFPMGDGDGPLAMAYYDSYDHIPADCPWDSVPEAHTPFTQGLLLATKVKVLGTTDQYIWSRSFYDEDGRPVSQYSQNVLGGHDRVSYTYDYAGQVLARHGRHLSAHDSLSVSERYVYDHRGRLLKNYHRVNQQAEILMASYAYNELGQLVHKRTHSLNEGEDFLHGEDFLYHRRGWLLGTNDPDSMASDRLFAHRLRYEDGPLPRYDGNISAVAWKSGYDPGPGSALPDGLAYQYDGLGRLRSSLSSTGAVQDGNYSELFGYDIRGNVTSISRYAAIAGSRQHIDSLMYSYDHDRHTRVDNLASGAAHGFADLVQAADEYRYDGNGRLTADDNKGIVHIGYNQLGLVDTVLWASGIGRMAVYTYQANGTRIRKTLYHGSDSTTVHYNGAVEYRAEGATGLAISLVHHGLGRLRPTGPGAYAYEYDLTDHLGNVRLSYDAQPGDSTQTLARIVQATDYYAFGSAMPGTGYVLGEKNLYLYNGKELQEESGWYDYGPRMYDADIGRWPVQDPLAERHYGTTPYHYVLNNPVLYADPLGLDTINMNKLHDGQRLPFGSVLDFGNGVYINWPTEFYTRYFMAEAQVYGYRNGANMTATGSTAGQAAFARLMAGMAEANGIAARSANSRAREAAAQAQLRQLAAMAAQQRLDEATVRVRERHEVLLQAVAAIRAKYGTGSAQDMSEIFDGQLRRTQQFFSTKSTELESMTVFPGTKSLTRLWYFTQMVKTNAPFDLKNGYYTERKIGKYSVYHDQVMLFDDYGNYNYGVAARAYGISLEMAIFGAGLNQVSKFDGYRSNPSGWFDDPRDTKMIIMGYNATIR